MDLLQVGMAVIAVGVAAMFVAAQHRVVRRPLVTLLSAGGAIAWLALWWGIAASGMLRDFSARPPPFMLVFLGTAAMGLTLGLSGVGRRLGAGLGAGALILAQGFRVPLEWVMHQAATRGVMPVQMSWSGWNFDVVTGVLAVVVGALAIQGKAPRWLLWAWTALAFVTLLTVATLGLVSTPMIHAFGTEPQRLNTWLADPPFVWLPTVMVAFALASQVAVVRQLWAESPAVGANVAKAV